MNEKKLLIIHHSGADHSFWQVNKYHTDLWNFISNLGYGIGYHYYIEKDGKVYQGREDNEIGAHCKGLNDISIGICLRGNFNETLPTKEQEKALGELLVKLQEKHNIDVKNIFPHRKVSQTDCYGKLLKDDWALNLYFQHKLNFLQRALKLLLEKLKQYV